MAGKSEKIDRTFLWLVLAAGFLALLLYGLSAFLAKPTVETITTHSANLNSDADSMPKIKFQNHNSR